MKKTYLLGALILSIVVLAAAIVALSLTGMFGSGEPVKLVFSTQSQVKIYDGEPLTNKEWKLESGELQEGHTVVPTIYGSQTNAGSSDNKMSVKILDENKMDVTSDYTIEYRLGKLTVNQKNIKVASDSATKQYDGTPISCETYRIVSGRLVNGHKVSVEFGSSRTDVGSSENIITVRILDASGADVTANYEVDTLNGSLTVSGYPLTISTPSVEKVYDGTPLENKTYELLSGELKDGDRLVVTVLGSQTNAGQSENSISVQIYNTQGEDVTNMYEVSKELGTLTVTKRDITVVTGSKNAAYGEIYKLGGVLQNGEYNLSESLASGHRAKVSVTGKVEGIGSADNTCLIEIFDGDGAIVTQNYNIIKELGKLEVLPADIVITSHSAYISYAQFINSGKAPLTCDEYDVSVGSLMDGHEILIDITGAQSVIGVGTNSFTVKIVDGEGNDVSGLYDIDSVFGDLEIAPIEIAIGTSGATKQYDGEALVANDLSSDWWIAQGELYPGHQITNVTFTQSQTNAGMVKNSVLVTVCDENGMDVTSDYRFSDEAYGYLEVTPLPLFITTESDSKMYDGEALRHEVYYVTGGQDILDARGDSLEVIFTEYPINAGNYSNNIKWIIKDANGNLISDNYEVDVTAGELIISKRVVTVRTGSASKDYDGEPLTCPEWSVVSETDVIEGHRLVVAVSGEQIEIGKSDNLIAELRVIVENEGERDITANYDLSGAQLGKLIVNDPNATEPDLSDPDNAPEGFNGEKILLANVKSSTAGKLYLREMSFGSYNGQGFDLPSSYQGYIDDTYGMSYLTSFALKNSNLASNQIDIEYLTARYFLPYYLDTAMADYRIQKSDVVYQDPACTDATVYYYDYWYSSDNPPPSVPEEYAEVELEYRKYVHETYLDMTGHEKTVAYLNGIIEEQGFSKDDPKILDKVASYIQGCASYNLEYNTALDQEDDVVIAFMEIYGEGVCRHYAMSATLLLRTLGIPARYTVGVYAEIEEANTWTEVYSNTGHAWVEAYIDGVGWVALEVTGGDRQFPDGSSESGGSGGNGGGESGPEKLSITPVVQPIQYYEGAVLEATEKNTSFTGNEKLLDLLKTGYSVECDISGSIDYVGYGTIVINNVKIISPNNEDVTSQYDISVNEGKLHMYEKPLSIKSGSITSDYTGEYITCQTYESSALLSDSHYLELTFGEGRREAGISQNYFTCKVYEGTGEDKTDVTYMYFIVREYGYITVNPMSLTITADETEMTLAELEELGGTYSATTYTVEGELFEGHEIVYVEQTGSISKRGRVVTDIISVKIVDQDGNDVSSTYNITRKKGLINITK